jgi:apolipoprotein N-acyltransferase
MYNSAVLISPNDSLQVYHKSKLVVGAEYTPFKKILVPLIGDWVTKTIGVSMGSNVSQKEPSVFKVPETPIKVAPIICYESVYAEYVTKYVQKGANLLAVITNDGWWGNTEGHRQHLSMARLRAVENRRDVVQSANTGISAHINQKGEIVQKLGYNKRGSITAKVHLNEQKTFYAEQGDYIARVAIFIAVLLFLYTFSRKKVRL